MPVEDWSVLGEGWPGKGPEGGPEQACFGDSSSLRDELLGTESDIRYVALL